MRRLALAACAVSAAGCLEVEVSGTGHTLPSGRSIRVNSDRMLATLSAEPIAPDTERVKFGAFRPTTVLVKPTSIEVDGESVATIPEETQSVTVAEKDGRLLIAADGASVYDEKF